MLGAAHPDEALFSFPLSGFLPCERDAAAKIPDDVFYLEFRDAAIAREGLRPRLANICVKSSPPSKLRDEPSGFLGAQCVALFTPLDPGAAVQEFSKAS